VATGQVVALEDCMVEEVDATEEEVPVLRGSDDQAAMCDRSRPDCSRLHFSEAETDDDVVPDSAGVGG